MYLIRKFESIPECYDGAERGESVDTGKINNRLGPSEKSIKNILDFARSYDVVETKSTGCVEIILN